ncbi:MarR family winged helix-turn-helix transcriptional regulator [Meiothermus luteus]|uniref:MarR family winged helix-turn-helix transcriptional regulator n=1 Tax=Meiothermus luteus TaxID=2026184 RepID=UPI001FEC9689|nr:MarR family transcriptional regulator [Meiothermus luteus]
MQDRLAGALERLAQAQRVLWWLKAEPLGLSPTQAQILLHLGRRPTERIGELAEVFDLTPATVSEAVRSLEAKGLLRRVPAPDRRSRGLELTEKGKALVGSLGDWNQPLREALDGLSSEEQGMLYQCLLRLLASLVEAGVVTVGRMCLLCQHFCPAAAPLEAHFCGLLKRPLEPLELRLDCPEFAKNESPHKGAGVGFP